MRGLLIHGVGQEEETTKHAKGARMGGRILFREESCRIIGACFEVYKEKGNGFMVNFGCRPKIEHERFVNQPL